MKGHCEMKGFLGFLMLRMISQQEMSGDDIRRELGVRKGCLPSAGTVYPALKELRENGFIKEIDERGRTKKYTITDKGKKEVAHATRRFVILFADLKEEFK